MKPAHAHIGPAKTLNTCLGRMEGDDVVVPAGAARRRSKKRREGVRPGEGRCCREGEEGKEERQLGDCFTKRLNQKKSLRGDKVVCGGEFWVGAPPPRKEGGHISTDYSPYFDFVILRPNTQGACPPCARHKMQNWVPKSHKCRAGRDGGGHTFTQRTGARTGKSVDQATLSVTLQSRRAIPRVRRRRQCHVG